MTNLSKELCEICGIEPKLDGSNPALSVQPVYPDFEQPENFVKLFKLITTIEKFRFTTGNFYISSIPSYRQDTALTANDEEYYSSNPDPIQAFITCVIKHCKRDKDTADYIRAEEWKYEIHS